MTSWYKVGIAFTLLVFLPVWVFNIADIPLTYKLAFTVVGGGMCWYAVENGGASRGMVAT